MLISRGSVCVIGANGFIGSKAVSALHARGYTVRATVRSASSQPEEWQHLGIKVVEADVTDPNSLSGCLDSCDVVVNCAGIYRWWVPDGEDYTRVNDEGAGHVAEACLKSGVRRLVHISTPIAYGYPKEVPFNESSEAGPHASEYARTKRMGDLRIKALTKGTSLELVTLYLGCVIGAGDAMSSGRIAAVINDYIQGKIPMLVGPDTRFIYVHIRDVQNAITLAVDAAAEQVAGEDFFIGNSDETMTTKSFFDLLGKHTGRKPPTRALNLLAGYWIAAVMTWVSTHLTRSEPQAPVDIMRTARSGSIEYDCRKSMDVLGLRYTSIDEAVAESVADVKQRASL